jgi:conjugal transfer pilin signal peptidase TrbI
MKNANMKGMRRFFYVLWNSPSVGIVCMGMILIVVFTQTRFYINHTPSLPYRAFICIKGLTPEYGDFVSIHNHPTQRFKGLHYIKRLVGFPRDTIHIYHNHLYVEKTRTPLLIDVHHIGPLHPTTQAGKILRPLRDTIIPKNYVFVSADHPQSFDSRYEEFGLVREECITGKCFGLLPAHNPSGLRPRARFRGSTSSKKEEIRGDK